MKIFQNLLCNHFTRAAKSNPRHEVSWVVEFSSSKDSNAEMGKMKTHFIILMQFSEIHKSNKSYVKHNNSQFKEAKTTQKHICRDPVWGCTVWQTCQLQLQRETVNKELFCYVFWCFNALCKVLWI